MDKLSKRIDKLLKTCCDKGISCIIIMNDGEGISALMNTDGEENIISLETTLKTLKPESSNHIIYH